MKVELRGADLVHQQLRRLHEHSQTTIRDGVAHLAFEVRDALAAEVRRALHWSSSGTERFISGGFQVRYRTRAGEFSAEIVPLERSAALIARHVADYTNRPGHDADLEHDGKLAVPIAGVVNRNARGKVPPAMRPAALLRRDVRGRNRGFVNAAGTVIMYRGAAGPVPAYALRATTAQRKRIDLDGAAARTVDARAEAVFSAAIAKARRAAGIT